MSEIEENLKLLREEVLSLKEIVLRLEKTCSRMDNHITFVDHVYDKVQAPFNFVLNKVSRVMGRTEQTLPTIKNHEEDHNEEDPTS